MDKLQLAILVQWAGDQGLQGRKRLQKVAYFLKRAGCPITADFTLHHYGPYSRDVADVCDEMVSANLLDEQPGNQYTYMLADQTPALIAQSRRAPTGRAQQMDPFQARAVELLNTEIWQLELGSTILYFYGGQTDWPEALKQACAYKRVLPSLPESQSALSLAQRYA